MAASEREGKKQVELLSDMGREITSSLDFDTIFGRLYDGVNQMAAADVFGVGLYHEDRQQIEYQLAIERGKRYAPYTRTTTDPNQLPVWCIEHREPVFINDVRAEYGKYVSRYEEPARQLEDGSLSREPKSIIYLPLLAKDRVLGIITIQSFEANAYTEHHLNVLRSLASYTAIALDNADAYRQLNEQEHEIRRLLDVAEMARAEAVEADAAKSSFLSTVSHELRTPLTSVLGFAKIIRKRLEDRIFPLVPEGRPQGRPDHPAGGRQPQGRRQRRRAAHQADRRRSRPREDRSRQARMAHGAGDHRRHHRSRDRRNGVALRAEGPSPDQGCRS